MKAEFTEKNIAAIKDSENLNRNMKSAFFEIHLHHIKRQKKGLLTLKSADRILTSYQKMFCGEKKSAVSRETLTDFISIFSVYTEDELMTWLDARLK